MINNKDKDVYCELARSLENDLIKIGECPTQRLVLGKPFPFVLSPRDGEVNNILL